MTDYLKDLNAAQAEAVTFGVSDRSTVGGPLLIIAGAGSGKTNTLAYRTAHQVRSGVDPQKDSSAYFHTPRGRGNDQARV